jgi:hypothetical protein
MLAMYIAVIKTSKEEDASCDSIDVLSPGRDYFHARRRLGVGLKSNKGASPFCKPNNWQYICLLCIVVSP